MNERQRVAVATLHYGFNEGAILQAFAVTRLLEEHWCNVEASIVDQRYPKKVRAYGAATDERRKALLAAIDQWLPLDRKPFRADDREVVYRHINERYDALVVGSDVVWSLAYSGHLRSLVARGTWSAQLSSFFPAFPNIYWPDSSVTIPKYSYAASIGSLEWNSVPRRHRVQMRELLRKFSAISVRDERTHRFLEWLEPGLADRAVMVPDPTLSVTLVEKVRSEMLRDRLQSLGVDFSRPLCGIVCGPHAALKETTTRLRVRGYQIIGITTENDFSDVPLFHEALHPLDWAALFGLMDLCIVERMHAAIFCIRSGTSFIALDSYETRRDNDSKTKSLMKRFGLQELCLSKRDVRPDEILERTENLERTGVAKERIQGELSTCRSEAASFLQSVAPLSLRVTGKSVAVG